MWKLFASYCLILPHIADCLILPHIATIVTRWQWLLMIYSSKFLWGNMTQIRAHCTNSEHVKTVCLILTIALHWWGRTCLNKLHQGLCANTEQAWSDFKLWFWKSLRANNHDRVGWSGDVVQAPPDFRSNDCQVSSSESPRDKNRAHNLDWPPISSIHWRLRPLLQVSKQKSIAMFHPLLAIKRMQQR